MTQWLPPTPPAGPWQPATEPAAAPPVPAPAPPAPADEQSRPLHKRIIGPLFLVGALLLKFGKIALLFLGKAKIFTTSLSMLVSIGAYTLIYGWKFAVGIVALLFVHEMGHYIQLRREGVKPSGMVFVPFLGAAVFTKSLGGNALAEARVGLAGPVLGTLGAAVCIPLYAATGDEFFKALAFTGFFLNLFNLLPMLPLDGGRAMAAMAPWMWFLGLGVMITLVFVFPNPIIILIALLGVFTTMSRWKAHRARKGEEGNEAYYTVRTSHRLMVGGVYLALIALLVVGMDATFVERSFDDA